MSMPATRGTIPSPTSWPAPGTRKPSRGPRAKPPTDAKAHLNGRGGLGSSPEPTSSVFSPRLVRMEDVVLRLHGHVTGLSAVGERRVGAESPGRGVIVG